MRIARFFKVNWQIARRVGRQEYDSAIHILERELAGVPSDSTYLELSAISSFSEARGLAIEFAKKALEFEPFSIEAIKVLTAIYAKRSEHELTARYIRHGLEHFPKPLPTTPKAEGCERACGASVTPNSSVETEAPGRPPPRHSCS